MTTRLAHARWGRWCGWLPVLLLLTCSGCADGPFWRLGYLSPWVVDEWEREEEMVASVYAKRNQIQAIRDAASDMDRVEADRAVETLGALAVNESILMLRINATRALGELPTPTASARLQGLLHDPAVEIRSAAVEAFAARPAAEAIPLLSQVISQEQDIDVRLAAARSLASFRKHPEAVHALGLALADPEPALQYRAMESLATVTGRDYGLDARRWQAYLNGDDPPESRGAADVAERFREALR